MNAFSRHHQPAIAFTYCCFDRLLLHGYIRALQFGGSIVAFLRHHRQAQRVTPGYLRGISQNYHRWVQEQARRHGLDLVTPPPHVRRHDWVEPYYRQLGAQPGVAVILKCRQRARVATCYPRRGYHIEPAWRCVDLYYFYLQDAALGRLGLRLCPYFPFDAPVCLNGHEWLAGQLRHQGIALRKDDNALLACDDPARLQERAEAFGPELLGAAVAPWLARWLPYFRAAERAAAYRHRLFVAQAQYGHNTISHRHAALDRLFSRRLDSNRAIGSPQRLAVIFGRPNFRADTRTAQAEVQVSRLKTTVLPTGFGGTTLKQYVKGKGLLGTQTACFRLRDLAVPKDVQHLPKLRQVLGTSNERSLQAQQDVLASAIDRGQPERLRPPTLSAAGRRTPGLRPDDARLLAVLQALTCFAYLIGKACLRTADPLGDVRRALGRPDHRLSQLRYDLGKLRGKGLVQRLPATQR